MNHNTVLSAALLAAVISFQSCTTAQINQGVGMVLGGTTPNQPVTEAEVGSGLREALQVGIGKGAAQAGQADGYFKNPLIKLLFPPEAQKLESRLRQIGLGAECDKFILALNRGAENAAVEAKPIFVQAIKDLTFKDVWGILTGEKNAATNYLRRTTTNQLVGKFKPHLTASIQKTNATRLYGELVTRYNQIPLVQKVNPDLADYATNKAVEGLFTLVEQEEANIRANPVARTTDLLRRVFARQDR